jgi:hypothetical protein
MNCRTRSSIRDGRRDWRRIGEKIRGHFIRIGITRTYEKHPENFMVLGVLIYPLDYLIRIIRFVLFGIIEFGRIYIRYSHSIVAGGFDVIS